MGDRGNVCVQQGKDRIWLYTHWCGSRMLETVTTALATSDRWVDFPYFVKHLSTMEGFSGIGVRPDDNEHPFLIVDLAKQKVCERPDKRKGYEHLRGRYLMAPVTFEKLAYQYHQQEKEAGNDKS